MNDTPTAPEVISGEASSSVGRPLARTPLVLNRRNFSWITERISGVVEDRAPRWWWVCFTITGSIAMFGLFCLGYQISTGVGVWGNNIPNGWAWDITNFVFWIGLGHAGTLISAILYLLRQQWRTSVNRAAEAMTLFAVMCAGIFPVIHMGRPWLAFWMFPYPNDRGPLWINFRSPLVWDFFAISTYFTISAIFWYVGLLPDLATLRDRIQASSENRNRAYVASGFNRTRARLFSWLSLGWSGSHSTWHRYEVVYLLLAALA